MLFTMARSYVYLVLGRSAYRRSNYIHGIPSPITGTRACRSHKIDPVYTFTELDTKFHWHILMPHTAVYGVSLESSVSVVLADNLYVLREALASAFRHLTFRSLRALPLKHRMGYEGHRSFIRWRQLSSAFCCGRSGRCGRCRR